MFHVNFRSSRLSIAATLAFLAVAIVVAVVGTACGGSDTKATEPSAGAPSTALQRVPSPENTAPGGSRVFVGHDKANKFSLGLILFSDSSAAAYVCDGDAAWTWFAGSVAGSEAKLTSADGAKLSAKINGPTASGTTVGKTGTTSAGGALEFTLDAAKDRAGLYRSAFSKGADSETAGWVIENDGSVRGGVGATVAGAKTTLGAQIVPSQLADVQALPEFAELKLLAPLFPVLPPDRTAFSHSADGLCGRLRGSLIGQGSFNSSTGVMTLPNTVGNHARLGLMGLIGCANKAGFFVF